MLCPVFIWWEMGLWVEFEGDLKVGRFGHVFSKRFLSCHGVVNNLFRLGRHMMKAKNYRILRERSFVEWDRVSCIQNIV